MSLYLGKKRVIAPTGRRKRTFSQFLTDTTYNFGASDSGQLLNPITSYVGVLEYLDGRKRAWLSSTFGSCSKLKEIPLLDTSKITTFYYAFYNCSSLTSLPQLDTSKVTTFYYAFCNCSSLTSLPQLDTSKVTTFYYAFCNCSSLTSLPQLDTSKVTNFNSAFCNCSSLTSLPQLDTSKVTNFYYAFCNCSSLTSANFTGVMRPTSIAQAFNGCKVLSNDSFPTIDTTDLTNAEWCYTNCYLLEDAKWTGTPPKFKTAVGVFFGCRKLKEIPEMDLSQCDYTSMPRGLFYNCSSATAIHAKNLPTSLDISTCTALEREGLVEVIGNLMDKTSGSTQTLTLGSTLKAKLTADDIKVATDKNWTVA